MVWLSFPGTAKVLIFTLKGNDNAWSQLWQKIGGQPTFVFKDLSETFGQNEPTNEKSIWNKSVGVVAHHIRRELY